MQEAVERHLQAAMPRQTLTNGEQETPPHRASTMILKLAEEVVGTDTIETAGSVEEGEECTKCQAVWNSWAV